MKKSLILAVLVASVCCAVAVQAANWEYGQASALNPAAGDASVAYVASATMPGTVVYSANSDVYGLNAETGATALLCDPDLTTPNGAHSANAWAPSGFLATFDGASLFFHDNGGPTTYLFQYNFGDAADTYIAFDTQCQGSIFSLAQNPWTNNLWFASADYAPGTNLYLYEVLGQGEDMEAVLRATITKEHSDRSSGNGPIIFKGPSTILLGETEAVYQEPNDGYFHLLDSTTGDVLATDYLTFTGGLAAATYGYNNEIFVTTGDGQTVEQVAHDQTTEVATTDGRVAGMAFVGDNFFIGEADINYNYYGAVLTDTEAMTIVTPTEGFRYASLPMPDFGFTDSAMAYYGDSLVYSGYYAPKAGTHKSIYMQDMATGDFTMEVDADFTDGSANAYSTAGLVMAPNGTLYFHDNGNPTTHIYRHKVVSGTQEYDTLVLTNTVQGSIFSMTWNPWNDTLWVSSASANDLHLYQINDAFDGIVGQGITIAKEHADRFSGNGPIIFSGEDTLLYGEAEAMWDGADKGYFHKVNVAQGTVVTDVMSFDGGLATAVYGWDNGIYVGTGNGNAVYQVDPVATTKTEVATLAYSVNGITFDGVNLYLTGFTPTYSNYLAAIWKPIVSGVPVDQTAPADTVDAAADLVVYSSAAQNMAVGVEAGANTTLESLEAVEVIAIADTQNMPANLPFGLVDFRAKVDTVGGTATITVHFSQAVSATSRWWKYDALNGWYVYPNAVLAADRLSMAITIEDGGFGDADGLANGYVVDPGGPGFPAADNPISTGDSGNCFVSNTGASGIPTGLMALALTAMLGLCLVTRREDI